MFEDGTDLQTLKLRTVFSNSHFMYNVYNEDRWSSYLWTNGGLSYAEWCQSSSHHLSNIQFQVTLTTHS